MISCLLLKTICNSEITCIKRTIYRFNPKFIYFKISERSRTNYHPAFWWDVLVHFC